MPAGSAAEAFSVFHWQYCPGCWLPGDFFTNEVQGLVAWDSQDLRIGSDMSLAPSGPQDVRPPGRVVNGTIHDDALASGPGHDYLRGFAGNDRIVGGGGNDRILGNDGNDILFGNTGDDVIFGQSGDDRLTGGAGNDLLDGGLGDDTLDYSREADGVRVDLAAGTAVDGSGGQDSLNNLESVLGSRFDDIIYGASRNETIKTGAGLDFIEGGAGHDLLDGGAGDDFLFGDTGDDTMAAGVDHDEVHGGDGQDTLMGQAGDDWMFGDAGNDRVFGQDGDDYLLGNDGNDRLDGGAGHDVLDGGEGQDVLTGGAGSDEFIATVDGGQDVITDFSTVDDDRLFVLGIDGVTTFAAFQALAGQAGADVVVTLGAGQTLVLQNVLLSQLTASNVVVG